jgi:uncharacterized protein YecE (DUF72 family)
MPGHDGDMTGRVLVGVSGWRYPRWRGDFYPPGLPQRRELEYVAERMTSVELNGSFYSLQRPSSYRAWAEQTPDDFVIAVKGSRFITHLKRLVGVEQAMANFFASGVLALGGRLGPVLWQLPEALSYDPEVVGAFLRGLPRTTAEAAELARRHDDRVKPDRALTEIDADRPMRHAVEFRSPSFDVPGFYAQLRDHGLACVVADTAGTWPEVDRDTDGFRYVRLHGDTELYTSGYSDEALDRWAERMRGWLSAGEDVHCYFDNDAAGHAPHDAVRLLERVRGSQP